MNIKSSFFALAVASALGLAGCGGGGGGGDAGSSATAAPVAVKLEDAQGFWSGALTGGTTLNASTTQAVVLADGTAWMLLLPASGAPTGMVKAKLALSGNSYTGSGHVYTLATGAASTATMTSTAQAGSTLTAALTAGGASTATNAALAYSSAYKTAAALSDVNGDWVVSASSGALRVNWTVVSSGMLSGTSSTGCTWTGSFATRTGGTAVLDFTATETCVGTATAYSGVAVLNSAKTAVTLFVTTDGDAQGFVLSLGR